MAKLGRWSCVEFDWIFDVIRAWSWDRNSVIHQFEKLEGWLLRWFRLDNLMMMMKIVSYFRFSSEMIFVTVA